MNFKAGDTVRLKSGGPLMTIVWVEGEECYCQWFDDKKVAGSKFRLVQLVADSM
jgi:uncharacterized protein YodC (DUF2158 family)